MVKWSPEKFTNEDRLHVADELLDAIKDRYSDMLIAVLIEGSTAKRCDSPESDLELRVLLEKEYGYHRWYSSFYKSMFIGISYNSFIRTLDESNEIDYEWPVSGDRIETAKVIYDPSGIYSELLGNNILAEKSADFRLLIREAVSDMYEHIYKVFTLKNNDYIALSQQISAIIYWAAISVGLANKTKFESSKSMIIESFKLDILPINYEEAIKNLISNKNGYIIKDSVGVLWESYTQWISQLGITLNDDLLKNI